MRIVRFKNGRYGVRRFYPNVFAIFSGCPFEFMSSWCVNVNDFDFDDLYATRLVNGCGWRDKNNLGKKDTYDTLEAAQAAYNTYLDRLKIAKERVAAATFDCGTPV